MCFILKQNARRGLIQERADVIPQQINIVLWIGIRKSLNRNVLTGREKRFYNQNFFFRLAFARMPSAEARGASPYISLKLFPEFRKWDDTTGFYLNFI
jgi:hypothetical protein